MKEKIIRWLRSQLNKKQDISNAPASTVEGERRIPSVNNKTSLQSSMTRYAGILFVVVLGSALLYQYYMSINQQKENATDKEQHTTTPTEIKKLTTPPPLEQQAMIANGPPPPPIEANGQTALTPEQLIAQRQQQSPVFFKTQTSSPTATASRATSEGISGTTVADNTTLGHQLHPTLTQSATATLLPDRNLVIAKGTFFDCALQTAIDTTVPGITTCLLSQDVYSDNGKVILLERGTQFTGEQKSTLSLGQKRVFILWTRAKTPKGVVIDIDSPATDALGRAGVDGEVDNHFWDRFGAAILLSLIQDGMSALASNQGSGNNTIVLPNTTNNSTDVVSTILKQTITIPPTIRKNQGGHINIIVARDLDFRPVYDLEVTGS